MLDAGVCRFYGLEDAAEPGMMPEQRRVFKSEHFFEERTVGVTRYRVALQNNERVDMLIRVWQNRTIRPNDLCEIGKEAYLVRQVQQTHDSDGLNVTDVELERMDADDLA